MNICIYGASSNEISRSYINAVEELGQKLAKHGHTLVFGGGNNGVMGAAARGAAKADGPIIGIAPSFFNVDGVLFEGCTKFIFTETMRERKAMMEDISDAFIMAPGGIGTFDEFFEILTLRQLGRHSKSIAIFNVNGYYDNLLNMLQTAVNHGFLTEECLRLCPAFTTPEKLIEYLEAYKGNIGIFKNIDK